jgi:hypothetical protein
VQFTALKFIVCKLVLCAKAPSPILVTFSGIVIDVIDVPQKALPPIVVRLSGRVMEVRLGRAKAVPGIDVMPFPKTNVASDVQPVKALG